METKTINFATTITDLELIIKESNDLEFLMRIQNRPIYGDVNIAITASEDVLVEFVSRKELSSCIHFATEDIGNFMMGL